MIPENIKQAIRDYIKEQHPTIHEPALMDAVAAGGGTTKSSEIFRMPSEIIVNAIQQRRNAGASEKALNAYTRELMDYFEAEVRDFVAGLPRPR